MKKTSLVWLVYVPVCGALLLGACESPPPAGDGGLPDAGEDLDAGVVATPMCDGLVRTPTPPVCDPLATDYAPGADDMWDACISDDGEYNRVQADISSIARVMAFEELRPLLFDPTSDPDASAFLDARLIYQRDQGIDSRVVRRYDPHYTVPDGTDCTLDGVPAMFPDYCVGPAQLGPRILASFASGIDGGAEPPRVYAARIEASLLIFFAVSTYKESLTCTTTAKDCDSAYAYYTGGEAARGGIGLAREVAAADDAAHQRAWDGALAVRCWRDLDSAETATDLAMRDRARTQYDRAITDGLAAILRARLVSACDAEGGELLYHWAFAQVLGDFLDRAARERDAARADTIATELARPRPGDADLPGVVDAIDAIFDCP